MKPDLLAPVQRINSIDALRAVASLGVVAHHIHKQFFLHDGLAISQIAQWLGWWGVMLFFVISGFCIHFPQARTAHFAGEIKLNRKRFLRHRFLRIYPPYVLAIAISLLVGLTLGPTDLVRPTLSSADVIAHLLFLHNFFPTFVYSINSVFWSIGIEVQFYVLYFIFFRWFRFSFPETFAFLLLALLWYFVVSVAVTGPWRHTLQQCCPTTFWVWHLGATLARHYVRGSQPHRAFLPPVLVASLLLGLMDPVLGGLHVVFWLAPILCAAVFWYSLTLGTAPFLRSIGDASYSLYLLHPVAIALAIQLCSPLGYLAAILLAFLLAKISYELVEAHFVNSNRNAGSRGSTDARKH